MGFPFFMPAYIPGNRIRSTAATHELEEAFRRQHGAPSLPGGLLPAAGAAIEFVRLEPGPTPTRSRASGSPAKRQLHAGDSYGYRFERDGKAVVYSTDSEHKLDDPDDRPRVRRLLPRRRPGDLRRDVLARRRHLGQGGLGPLEQRRGRRAVPDGAAPGTSASSTTSRPTTTRARRRAGRDARASRRSRAASARFDLGGLRRPGASRLTTVAPVPPASRLTARPAGHARPATATAGPWSRSRCSGARALRRRPRPRGPRDPPARLGSRRPAARRLVRFLPAAARRASATRDRPSSWPWTSESLARYGQWPWPRSSWPSWSIASAAAGPAAVGLNLCCRRRTASRERASRGACRACRADCARRSRRCPTAIACWAGRSPPRRACIGARRTGRPGRGGARAAPSRRWSCAARIRRGQVRRYRAVLRSVPDVDSAARRGTRS